MGNDVSRQADVRHLQEQGMPFEQAELEVLVAAYYNYYDYSNNNNDNKSFESSSSSSPLSQWLLGFASLQAERLAELERNVLPCDFGDCLTRLLQLQTQQQQSLQSTSDNRQQHLTRHVETVANATGRRGHRAALGTLFQLAAVEQHQEQQQEQSTTSPVFNTKDLVDAAGREIKANVVQVLDLSFRLAVATRMVQTRQQQQQQQQENEEEDDSDKNSSDEKANELSLQQQQEEEEAFVSYTTTPQHVHHLAAACIRFVHQIRLRRSVEYSPRSDALDEADWQLGRCSKMDFCAWAVHDVPQLAAVLPTFWQTVVFHHILPVAPLTLQLYHFPLLRQGTCLGTRNDNNNNNGAEEDHDNSNDNSHNHDLQSILFSFGCINKALGGQWHRLYTSTSDGLSFHGLHDALLGYNGPTLLVIRALNGSVFGAFTASCWKESKDYYGTTDCFLYQLQPEFAIFRPCRRERNFMFCRSTSFSKGTNSSGAAAPNGIGFGGSAHTCPRLFLDESFAACYVSSRDTTFEPGHLMPRTDAYSQKQYFLTDWMEVWGCGGQDAVSAALSAQAATKAVRAAYLQKNRQVDKTAFVADLRSGLIASKAFGHMEEIHGSTRYTLLNRGKKEGDYC